MLKYKTIKEYIEWVYQDAWTDPESVIPSMKTLEEYSKRSEEAFKYTIDIFNQEKNIHKKLILSDVLVNLNYAPVKDFLIDVLLNRDDCFRPKFTNDSPEKYALHVKVWSAINLAQMKKPQSLDFLKALIPLSSDSDNEWIVYELSTKDDDPQKATAFSLRALLELADFSEKIAAQINRAEIEERLKKLEAK